MTLLTTPQKQAPPERFLLPICTDRAGLSALLSLLHFGAFEAGYLDNEQLFYDVLEALAFIDDPTRTACTAPPPPPPDKTTIKEALKRFASGVITLREEEQEEMPCQQIIKIGSRWYLYSDCAGCDQPLYFELTQTSLDANAQPVPTGDSTKLPNTETTPIADSRANCFASKAVPYLLQRAAAFWDTVADVSLLGIDEALGNYDDFANYALLVAEMLTGNSDLSEIAGIGKTAVKNAILSEQTQAALIAAWTFTAPPTKDELSTLVSRAPFIVDNVPVRLALQAWLKFSVVFNYSVRLNVMLEQCREENPDATNTEVYTSEDAAYRIIRYTSQRKITDISSLYLAEFEPVQVVGLAYIIRANYSIGSLRFAGITKESNAEYQIFETTLGDGGEVVSVVTDNPTVHAALQSAWQESAAYPAWLEPFDTVPRTIEGVGFRVEAAEAQSQPYEVQLTSCYVVIAL